MGWEIEEVVAAVLAKDGLNGAYLPFVAILAMKESLRNEYGDLLKKRLLESIPYIESSPHLTQCAVLAGSALNVKDSALDKALLSLFKSPPENVRYMDETMLSLTKDQAHLIPRLLEMEKQATKAPFPYDAAISINSDDPEVIKFGKSLVLTSESHAQACNAAKVMNRAGKPMSLEEIPKKRLEWLLKITKDDIWQSEQFYSAFEEEDEMGELLKALLPSFRILIANRQ